MRNTTNFGFTVWDLDSDRWSKDEYAANLDLIDEKLHEALNSVNIVSVLPSSPSAGDLVMLNIASSGFPAWTLLRADSGGNWRTVGPVETASTLPTTNLFNGRTVLLTAASGSFPAWCLVIYGDAEWHLAGGLSNATSGDVVGLHTALDVYITDASRGLVLTDRTNGNAYRVFMTDGYLQTEEVDIT